MRSTYLKEDVILILKDITGLVKPQSTEEREKLIQAGKHYCEMLPIEYTPTQEYMESYEDALTNYSDLTAKAIGILADKIIEKRGKNVILVSLARAGIPIGILLKKYIYWKYNVNPLHYSISIIRGKGIDSCAINYILSKHKAEDILFIDGWIGKGAIQLELKKEVSKYIGLSSELGVVSDPANITQLCGTHSDILIPNSCLNATVSGLISRTFLREDIIGKEDFHGALFYENLIKKDLSYQFINKIESKFKKENTHEKLILRHTGIEEVSELAKTFKINNINLIKPGIGETTRVLLRRIPWKILISNQHKEDICLNHIIKLAKEKDVPIEIYPLKNYKACGIIKKMEDI